jgi:hypothetical protein
MQFYLLVVCLEILTSRFLPSKSILPAYPDRILNNLVCYFIGDGSGWKRRVYSLILIPSSGRLLLKRLCR